MKIVNEKIPEPVLVSLAEAPDGVVCQHHEYPEEVCITLPEGKQLDLSRTPFRVYGRTGATSKAWRIMPSEALTLVIRR